MRKILICVTVYGLLACLPSTAAAEPIRLTSGVFDLDLEGDVLAFFAPGFSVSHVGPNAEGIDPNIFLLVPKILDPAFCAVCDAGQSFTMSFRTPGEEHLGIVNATVNGASFSNITLRGTLDFRAESVVLPLGLPPGTFFDVSSPFAFSGSVRGFNGDSEVFAVSLFGSGHTRAPFFFGLNRFFMEETGPTFFFDDTPAVPEPSTMMLVGLGAAALARARKRTPTTP